MEADELPSNASELLTRTAIKKDNSQPEALHTQGTEFQELTVKIESLQSLQAGKESSATVPVVLIHQTQECIKVEFILDNELSYAVPHSQEPKQTIRETTEEGSKTDELSPSSYLEVEQSQTHECGLCPQSFPNAKYLGRHMVTHAKPGNGKGHIKTHADDTHNCEVCGKNYKQEHNLKKHRLREHSDEKRQDTLGRQTLNDSSVHTKAESILSEEKQQSVRVHEEEFACQTCGKTFPARWRLNRHRRAHDSRTYECRVCGAALKNERNLNGHMLRRHPGEAQQLVSEPQTANADSIQTKTELKSEEEFIEEDNGEAPTQQNANCPEDPCECKLCGRMFTQESLLTQHMRNHPKGRKELACQICGETFSTRWSFYNHRRAHDSRTYACGVCGATFRYNSSRKQHIVRRHPREAQQFVSEPQAANADVVHTKTELTSNEEFLKKDNAAERGQQNAGTSLPGDSVTCEVCRHIYPKELFKTHMRLAHSYKRFKCKLCPKAFYRPEELNRHMNTHVKDKKREFPCKTCGKKFSALLSLRDHKAKVHTGKLYRFVYCQICGAAFRNSTIRKQHMAHRHPGVPQQFDQKAQTASADSVQNKTKLPSEEQVLEEEVGAESVQGSGQNAINSKPGDRVSCEICHKSYSKELFGAHLRVAHSEKAYKCELCPKSYTTKRNLKQHMTKHANDGEEEKTYKCELCPKFLTGMKNLKRHIRTHAKDKKTEFACPICGKTFTARSTLHDHRIKVHTDITYDCRVCGAGFRRKIYRNEHMLRRHPDEAQQLVAKPQTANADSVQIKTELKSEEEFIEEDDGAAPTQQNANCPEDAVRCGICHNIYPKELFSAHLRVSHYEKTHKCELCPKCFHRPAELKQHMKTHTKDRKRDYACQICGETFFSRSSLNRHRRKFHESKT